MLKFLGIFCLFFFAGCGIMPPYRPFPLSVEMREYKGIVFYNAGPAKDEPAWNEIFAEVDMNILWLSLCVGADANRSARAIPIILYPEPLFFGDLRIGGLNDQKRIYMSSSRGKDSIAHEWIHTYLFLIKDYPTGDMFHTNQLWKTCGFK